MVKTIPQFGFVNINVHSINFGVIRSHITTHPTCFTPRNLVSRIWKNVMSSSSWSSKVSSLTIIDRWVMLGHYKNAVLRKLTFTPDICMISWKVTHISRLAGISSEAFVVYPEDRVPPEESHISPTGPKYIQNSTTDIPWCCFHKNNQLVRDPWGTSLFVGNEALYHII